MLNVSSDHSFNSTIKMKNINISRKIFNNKLNIKVKNIQ